MKLQHHYQSLGEAFSQSSLPEHVRNPTVVLWNQQLADTLGIKANNHEASQFFSGNALITGSKPVAMAYSGHQFGQFNPHLGDGRAHLLGELRTAEGLIKELQLKGSGRTPFSRNGDGKCGIKPAVREYIMSEAMHALGVPTTRCLAVVSTGEDIQRQTTTPGAVVTRVADSHLRVGTFEYFAARGMHDEIKVLADIAVARHYPEINDKDDTKYLQLISHVIDKQIHLITEWMRVGFIHGVMNTDNTLLSGDTIDYGPCAMMGVYDPNTVFSSIDHQGRYAFGNQPWIAQWNMARFAESLLPVIVDGGEDAIALVTPLIESYQDKYQQAFSLMMAKKIGFSENSQEASQLCNELLEIMFKKHLDYTETFTQLKNSLQPKDGTSPVLHPSLMEWQIKWQETLNKKQLNHQAVTLMAENNPLAIPRNHLIEQVLTATEANSAHPAASEMLKVVQNPYTLTENTHKYQVTDKDADLNYQTYCGT
ncbi:YdiU family protein [Marinicella sp. S1101]|uniref:protein adenylyltransferase SelO n=1 Tax=Marinicella marina TaxID=2996016 RepID=UPI002260CFA5|nr:YdiU family protein [Marinicella marina]MCX7553430.1 YdiU family protein [Marinicella marina]MDJ1140054.1 YdiU family protein [Marinicella marina]